MSTPAIVPNDLPCKNCGYNLRDLPIRSNCPECGTPIQKSLQRHRADLPALHWLDRLALGIHLLFAGLATALLICIAGGCCAFVTPEKHALTQFVWLTGWFISITCTTLGWHCLTTPYPAAIADYHFPAFRLAARWSVYIALFTLFFYLLQRIAFPQLQLPHPVTIALLIIPVAAWSLHLQYIQLYFHFIGLPIPTPQARLLQSTGSALLLCLSFTTSAQNLLTTALQQSINDNFSLLFPITCIAIFTLLAFYAILLHKLLKAIQQEMSN